MTGRLAEPTSQALPGDGMRRPERHQPLHEGEQLGIRGVFRRRRYLAGAEASELCWYTPSGEAMTTEDWADPNARSLAIYLDGADDPDRGSDGSPLVDDDFLVLVNAWWEPLDFTIPPARANQGWWREIDSFDPSSAEASETLRAGDRTTVGPRSVQVLRGRRDLADRTRTGT